MQQKSKSMTMDKKEWLDYLYYYIGNQKYNFELCGTYGDKQFTKWKKYLDCVSVIDINNGLSNWKDRKYFEDINQRQILQNEIVLDLEDPNQLPDVIIKLETGDYEYSVFKTGSRGYHIHIIFKEDFTEKEKLAILKYFSVDEQKASDKNMIALENCPHWKTGKLKEQVFEW